MFGSSPPIKGLEAKGGAVLKHLFGFRDIQENLRSVTLSGVSRVPGAYAEHEGSSYRALEVARGSAPSWQHPSSPGWINP